MRLALLILSAAALSACIPGRIDRVSGVYEGTIAAPDATLPFEMRIVEGDTGRVVGTAMLSRGDVRVMYTVMGSRDQRTLRLALDTESDDLVLFVTPRGERLDGTATGGDLVRAAVQTTRTGAATP